MRILKMVFQQMMLRLPKMERIQMKIILRKKMKLSMRTSVWMM